MRYFFVDLIEGFRSLWRWYIGAVALFAAVSASLVLQALALDMPLTSLSVGDFFLYYFAGASQFFAFGSDPFRLPVVWSFVCLFALNLVLWYPYRDFLGFGRVAVVAGGSRWRWWFAKCAWVIVAIAAFCLCAFIVAILSSLLFGGRFSLTASEEMPFLLGLRESQLAEPPYLISSSIAVLFASLAALALFQLFLSLVTGPAISFACSISILFLSAFYFDPLLIGNSMMLARSGCLMEGGVSVFAGMCIAASLAGVSIVMGGLLLSRMDITDKERFK